MLHRDTVAIAGAIALSFTGAAFGQQSTLPQPVMQPSSSSDALKLEREKFEYQKDLERQKLEVERLKAWSTGGSILIPLILGVSTLAWQTRSANKLKDRDAKDLFDLKAAEIIFKTDSTIGSRNRARALTALFPDRLPSDFGETFEPKKFQGGGPRYEARLEVFKAACEKVSTPNEVYRIWCAIFPDDNWIKPLISEPAGNTLGGGESVAQQSAPPDHRPASLPGDR